MNKLRTQEKPKIPVDGEYYAIVIGKHRKHRTFWRNLLFTDPSIATFYLEQEAFAYKRAKEIHEADAIKHEFENPIPVKDDDIPKRYTIEDVYEWEVEDRQSSLKLFELPETLTVVLSNYDISRGMTLPVKLHDEQIERMYYSGRFAFLGKSGYNELVEDHGAKNVSWGDSMLLGVRMRPAIQAPLRKHFFSMCGDGLPGLWYINIGERVEKVAIPLFTERTG